jgi:hypothetical protein
LPCSGGFVLCSGDSRVLWGRRVLAGERAEHASQLGKVSLRPAELRQLERCALKRLIECENPEICRPGLFFLALELQNLTNFRWRIGDVLIVGDRRSVRSLRFRQFPGFL